MQRTLVAVLLVAIVLMGVSPDQLTAGGLVPELMSYQGLLTDAGGDPVADGSYSIVFTIYDAASAGTSKWTETQSVATVNGLFAVLLGSVNPMIDTVFADSSRWLGLAVEGDPEITPRTKLTTSAYAYRVARLDGARGGTITGDVDIQGDARIGTGHGASANETFVAGRINTAGGFRSTVTGGSGNTATAQYGVIAGGGANDVTGEYGIVAGGRSNLASGDTSFVGGGGRNTASGKYAATIGGYRNEVAGDYALAAGYADSIGADADYSVLFGIDSDLSQDSTFMVDMPHVRIGDETTGYELPTVDGTADQVMTTDGAGKASWASVAGGSGHSGAIYRWMSWSTYSQGNGWIAGNEASLFGGITPSVWGDSYGTAGDMSDDMEVLRTLFTRKGYGGKNATIEANEWDSYSSTNSRHTAVLFRIKNTTGGDITWTLWFWYTSNAGWQEIASVALNGTDLWTSSGISDMTSTSVALTIPANQTSTIIVISASSQPTTMNTPRTNLLAFYNNCLELPAGLEYVDDLDTAP